MSKSIHLPILFIFFILVIDFSDHTNSRVELKKVQREFETISVNKKRSLVKQRKEIRKAASNNEVFQSVEELGPNLPNRICDSNLCYSGMIKELVIDSQDENVFVIATETSGAWVSYNRGMDWNIIDDDWLGLKFNWVSQSNENPDIF